MEMNGYEFEFLQYNTTSNGWTSGEPQSYVG